MDVSSEPEFSFSPEVCYLQTVYCALLCRNLWVREDRACKWQRVKDQKGDCVRLIDHLLVLVCDGKVIGPWEIHHGRFQ